MRRGKQRAACHAQSSFGTARTAILHRHRVYARPTTIIASVPLRCPALAYLASRPKAAHGGYTSI